MAPKRRGNAFQTRKWKRKHVCWDRRVRGDALSKHTCGVLGGDALFKHVRQRLSNTCIAAGVLEATPFQTCVLRQVCRGDALSNTCVATGVLEATAFQSLCDRRVRGHAISNTKVEKKTRVVATGVLEATLKRVLREACPRPSQTRVSGTTPFHETRVLRACLKGRRPENAYRNTRGICRGKIETRQACSGRSMCCDRLWEATPFFKHVCCEQACQRRRPRVVATA